MRSKWAAEWEAQKSEIYENHKKVQKIILEQEDIQIKRDSLDEAVQHIEGIVGHVN